MVTVCDDAVIVAEMQLGVGLSEFGEALPAAAAGRDLRHALGDDGDLGDLAAAAHDVVAERRGLGAPSLRIGRDLDVGAGEDLAVVAARSAAPTGNLE